MCFENLITNFINDNVIICFKNKTPTNVGVLIAYIVFYLMELIIIHQLMMP